MIGEKYQLKDEVVFLYRNKKSYGKIIGFGIYKQYKILQGSNLLEVSGRDIISKRDTASIENNEGY